MTPQKKKRRKQQAQLAEDMTAGQVRKAIENARELVDSIGHYAMKFDGTRYTVRLSKRTVGIVAYDAESGEVVIVLPDKTRWHLDVPERFRRNMLIHIKDTEDMFHKQARLDELEGLVGKIWEMASAGRLGDAGVELARENARLSNMIREMGDALQEAASLQNAFDAERRKAVRSKKRAEGAEADKKRAEESLKKADEELARTKSRNSRLAAAANKIKTKKAVQKAYRRKKGRKAQTPHS